MKGFLAKPGSTCKCGSSLEEHISPYNDCRLKKPIVLSALTVEEASIDSHRVKDAIYFPSHAQEAQASIC